MIKEALDKQAAENLQQLKIYVNQGKGKPPKVVVKKFHQPKETRGNLAMQAIGRGVAGSSLVGGLPFALMGLTYSGEVAPFFGKGRSSAHLADLKKGSPEALKFIKDTMRAKTFMRALALGGLVAGSGSALYKPTKDWLASRKRKHAGLFNKPLTAGKFKNQSTPQVLGAPGRTIEQVAVKPDRPIKEALEKQAALIVAEF